MVQARVLHRQIAEGALALVGVAAGGDDFHGGGGEAAADARAEVAVASDHNDPQSPSPNLPATLVSVPPHAGTIAHPSKENPHETHCRRNAVGRRIRPGFRPESGTPRAR